MVVHDIYPGCDPSLEFLVGSKLIQEDPALYTSLFFDERTVSKMN